VVATTDILTTRAANGAADHNNLFFLLADLWVISFELGKTEN